MPDPDFEIRGGGGGGGKGQTPKTFFLPFGPQFSLKISGSGGGGGAGGRAGEGRPQHSECKHFDLDLSKQLISKRVCQWSFLAN